MTVGMIAMTVFLGCYTNDANTNGLYALDFDVASGAMVVAAAYPVPMAIYQALSPDGKVLYSCRRGGVASFGVDGAKLSPIDTRDVGGTPCHVSVMPDGRQVNWADYSNGRAGFVASADGKFGEGRDYAHSGSGPNLPRQNKAHCHQAIPAPDGRSFCVVDLGIDEIVTYPEGRIFRTEPAGAGPRHMIFHPGGKLAFVAFELKNLVASYRVGEGISFSMLDQKHSLHSDDTGRGYDGDLAAAIRFSPDLRRVIVSNRGENSLVAYDYDPDTGRLSSAARSLLPGSWPRDFIFVNGNTALAAMERTGEVLALRYDAATGRFAVIGAIGGFFRPVALLAAPGA